MLSNASQYSPQGFMPQFAGPQGAGSPQMSPGLFGQSGAHGAYGFDPTQAGQGQPYPSGTQTNPFQQNPFMQSQFAQTPFAASPYPQNPLGQGSGANPLLNSFAGSAGAQNPAQHVIALLGQLAQHVSIHAAITQQIGIALHQLTQHLAVQSLGHAGGNLGVGQPSGFGGPFAGNPGGAQYFGQNPFAGSQGGYAGLGWGANRPQTIQ